MTHVRSLLAVLILLSALVPAIANAEGDVRDRLSRLTGAHSRVVWVQDTSHESADTFARGNSLKLMGYDSRDGKGERAIVRQVGSYAKPLLTPDGQRVVYSDRKKGTMHWVKFGGGDAQSLGRGFAVDFVSVQEWAQVTDNERGDFYPDAWIEGGSKSHIPKSVRGRAAAVPKEKLGDHDTWPGDTTGLLFLWQNVGASNQFRRDGNTVTCRVRPRGKAIFGRWGSMDTADGAFTAPDADKRLLAACRKTNRLAIEATITPADLKQDGPARIVSFSQDSGSRNFTLGQSGDELVFRLRTPRTGDNGTKPQVTLAKLAVGKPHHVVVSYVPGRLLCSVNGKQTVLTAAVKGGLSNWKPMHLVFGDEYEGGRDWAGRIEGVAIYNRFIGPKEAKQKYELYAKATKDRKKPRTLKVTGKLIEKTVTPAIEDLEDYKRALVVYTYEVKKVAGGKYPHKKMLVAHWAVLDRKKLGLDRQIGKTYTMTVEKYADREELEGERYFSDSEEFDLPVYYDLSR